MGAGQEPVPLDDKGKHWGCSSEYPDLCLVNEEKGSFLLCRNRDCPERFPVLLIEKKGVLRFELDKGKLKLIEEE